MMAGATSQYPKGNSHTVSDPVASLTRHCTCCGQLSTFQYIGTQYFPSQVTALRPGGKTSLTLWTCNYCATTLSNLE
jgi:hypothetical protein